MAPTQAQPLAWSPQGSSGHPVATKALRQFRPGTLGLLQATALPWSWWIQQHLQGDRWFQGLGMTASPASGGVELWERQRPQGRCLSVLIRDRCAPPHPTPPSPVPARTGLPLSHCRAGRGGYLRGSLPAALRLRSWGPQGSAVLAASYLPRLPEAVPAALPPRCAHLRGRTALGLDGSTSPRLRLRFCAPGLVPLTALAGPRRAAARARKCL